MPDTAVLPTVDEAVARFAAEGGPVLGICNGFQVLCEAGMLPGALLLNENLRFVHRQVELLDDAGEQLLAELREPLGVLSDELDHAADPHMLDAVEAERRQRPLDRLALRVEDSLLGADQHPSLQNVSPVIRS